MTRKRKKKKTGKKRKKKKRRRKKTRKKRKNKKGMKKKKRRRKRKKMKKMKKKVKKKKKRKKKKRQWRQKQQTEESLYHKHISFKGCLSCSFSVFFHQILAWKLHHSLLLHTHCKFSPYYSNRTPVWFVELYTYRENFIPLCFIVLHANMNFEHVLHVLHMLWKDTFKIHLSSNVAVIKCKSGSNEDGRDRSGTV